MSIAAWIILPFGPIIGSWLGVLVRRFENPRNALWGRSACDSCGAALHPREMVPLASFFIQRGRCRHCGAPIGWFHPAIELAALAVGAIALAADGPGLRAWTDAGLGWALLLAGWIDLEYFTLPDWITLPLILAGLAVTWSFSPASIFDHAAAAALGYLGFRLMNAAYRAWRGRDGLGQGDAKLLAAAGAWLGAAALPDEILAAGLIGLFGALLAGRHVSAGMKLPFGPALALACFGLRLAMP
jgi:leader peptidase (prepilin peptidase)/N-methyltransferase